MSGQFAILNPCQKRWSDLCGDTRKRFCGECHTYVHVLDQYSPREFEDLRRESPGQVCGFLAGESLPERRSRRAILVGAMLTAISPLMAQSGRVRIRVTDMKGEVILGAEASLLGADGKPQTERANEAGEVVLRDLPYGDSKVRVNARGFSSRLLTVTVRNGDELKVDTQLEVGTVGGAVFVELVPMEPRPDEHPTLIRGNPELTNPPRPKRRWWQIFH